LKAIVAEVDAQGTGIVDRHPYDLEDKGSHRGEIMMMVAFYLRGESRSLDDVGTN